MSTVKTLDYLAAKTAQNLVEEAKHRNTPRDIQTLITKVLGVLQAQGVYAMYLFLYSQAEKSNPATFVLFHLWNMLKDSEVPVPLPDNVHVVAFQDTEVLFCEPMRLSSIIDKSYKDKEKAKENAEKANNCVNLVKKHSNLWEHNRQKFSSSFPEIDFGKLDNLEYKVGNDQGKECKIKADSDLHNKFTKLPSAREIILANIRDLATDLDALLLVRDLYEQTLIYARYHAKALGGEK